MVAIPQPREIRGKLGIKKEADSALCIVLGMDHTTLEAYTAYLAGHAKVRRCR